MTTERADRPPFSAEDAAAELRRLASQGVLEPRATHAVLVAAGHGEPEAPASSRPRTSGRALRVAKSTCCASRRGDSRRRRSPIGSSSRRRPPTTTSSTSTTRSASRREPPPRSGPCNTPSSADVRAVRYCTPRRTGRGGLGGSAVRADTPHVASLPPRFRPSSVGYHREDVDAFIRAMMDDHAPLQERVAELEATLDAAVQVLKGKAPFRLCPRHRACRSGRPTRVPLSAPSS